MPDLVNRPEASALAADISKEVLHCSKWARHNYNWAQVVFVLSVLSSFVAAILVGVGPKDWTAVGLSETGGRILLAVLTGLPASFLLINNTLRFEERAKWCWKKCRKCENLLRKLRDDPSSDIPAISAEFSTVSEELENEWPAFGATPSQPKK
jgi:hypothetical protein